MENNMFPVCDCNSCGRRCSLQQIATFKRNFIFAWARLEQLPDCPDYLERCWRGRQMVRA